MIPLSYDTQSLSLSYTTCFLQRPFRLQREIKKRALKIKQGVYREQNLLLLRLLLAFHFHSGAGSGRPIKLEKGGSIS
jgi:hypothetical protein